jgi:hypothetical protein
MADGGIAGFHIGADDEAIVTGNKIDPNAAFLQ